MIRFEPLRYWLAPALGGIALLGAVYAHWGPSAELTNRALIIAASGRLLYRSRSSWLEAGGKPAPAAGLTLLALGLIVLPPAAFLAVQFGPRTMLVWWLYAGWLAAVAGATLAWRGFGALRAAAFPLLFLVFALPAPDRLERPLQARLQEWTTSLSATSLNAVGIACERQGYVLSLPGGDLGVMEACSGIRSVGALTAIAALVAHLRGMGLIRGALFVPLCLPVVIVANVFRVVTSGVLHEKVGVSAVQGTPHDLLGFAGVLLGLAALVGLSGRFVARGPRPAVAPAAAPPSVPRQRRWVPVVASAFSWLTLAACAAAALLGHRSVEHLEHTAQFDQVSLRLGPWRGEDVPIPIEVQHSLMFDLARHRVYRNGVGQEVHVWMLFWSGSGAEFGFHSPDVCWPNRGWTVTQRRGEELELARGCRLPVSVRQFRNSRKSQMLMYWVQDGGRVLTEEVEAARPAGPADYWWIRQRLAGQPAQRTGRLAILVGTDLWGSGRYAEQELAAFTQLFVREVHRVMPWARPDDWAPADPAGADRPGRGQPSDAAPPSSKD